MKRLKVNNLSENRFNEIDLANVCGGAVCGCVSSCGCRYADEGGSSTNANANANGSIAANNTHGNGASPADVYVPITIRW